MTSAADDNTDVTPSIPWSGPRAPSAPPHTSPRPPPPCGSAAARGPHSTIGCPRTRAAAAWPGPASGRRCPPPPPSARRPSPRGPWFLGVFCLIRGRKARESGGGNRAVRGKKRRRRTHLPTYLSYEDLPAVELRVVERLDGRARLRRRLELHQAAALRAALPVLQHVRARHCLCVWCVCVCVLVGQWNANGMLHVCYGRQTTHPNEPLGRPHPSHPPPPSPPRPARGTAHSANTT